MTKIAVDARFLGEAGPGRYIKNILEQLEKIDPENNYIVYLSPKGFEQYKPTNPNFKKVQVSYKWYSWGEQFGFLFRILKDSPDILYVPHFNVPILYNGKLVTAIPDIIMHSFSTERGTTLPKFYFRFKKFIYGYVIGRAVNHSSTVIVPSKDVKADFTKYYPAVAPEKFVVAYEGVDPVFHDTDNTDSSVLKEFNISTPFLLYISSMYEHKNVPFMLEAFEDFIRESAEPFKLVIVGKNDKFARHICDMVREKRLEDRILMPGMTRYITDAELTVLRRNAAAYVFPSLKEGFSLTPLEAQATGLTCLISDIPCHREIYGDSVIYFDPKNKSDMVDKLNTITSDNVVREKLKLLGFENVKKYDWKNTAEVTLKIFRNLTDHV